MNTNYSLIKKIILHALSVSILIFSSQSYSAIYSKPTTYLDPIPVYGPLGSGHISDLDYFTLTKCLNGTESYEGAPIGTAVFTAVSTREELKSHLSLTVAGNIAKESFSANANVEFSQDTQEDSYSLVAIFDLRYTLYNEAFNPVAPVLNGIGENAISNPSTFINTCGTHFVSQRQTGGDLYVAVRINFSSIEAKQKFKVAGGATLKDIGNFSASFTSNSSLYREVLGITVFAHQRGGNPSALGGVLIDQTGTFPAANCSRANLTSCQNAINSIVNYAGNDLRDQLQNPAPGTGPAILGYAYRNYENVGVVFPFPPSAITEEILSARQQLAEELEKNTIDYNRANLLLSDSGKEIHPNYLSDVGIIASQITSNIGIIRDAGLACFDYPTECPSIRDTAIATLNLYDQNILLVGPRIPLHRYNNGTDHLYTTNFNELGGGGNGWIYEGITGYVLRYNPTGTVPLYRYYSGSGSDHLYTTNWFELGNGGLTYTYERVEAYIYPNQVQYTVPLYRYFSHYLVNHFYTANYQELGSGTYWYVYEKIEGYLFANWYD